MKKILIGAILASNMVISGDINKCSNSLKKYFYWVDRAHNFTSSEDGWTKQMKLEARDMYFAFEKEIIKYCKNILSKEIYHTRKLMYDMDVKYYNKHNITFKY